MNSIIELRPLNILKLTDIETHIDNPCQVYYVGCYFGDVPLLVTSYQSMKAYYLQSAIGKDCFLSNKVWAKIQTRQKTRVKELLKLKIQCTFKFRALKKFHVSVAVGIFRSKTSR